MQTNGSLTTHRGRHSGIFIGGILAASALLAGVIVVGTAACSRDTLQKGLAGPVPGTPEDLLAELRDDKTRIDQTTDQMMKRIDAFNASRRSGERQIQFSEIFYEDLTGEQRDVLNALLAEEKDVSYKALIQNIIKDRETLRNLQERVLHLEQTLPDRFVLVRKGDTHHELATRYLRDEAKVDEARAKTLLAGIDQTDELLPGNKVWFFYDAERDIFRTYVTQGEAGRTPLAVRRALKRQLITERDEAMARAESLEQTRANLESQRAALESDIIRLNSDIASLTDRRSALEADVAVLRQDNTALGGEVARLSRDLAFRQNSLFYHAANERDLREKGVLTAVFKRVRDVKGIEFEDAIDLRLSTTIMLAPRDLGLERIKEVRLLPSMYMPGRDFTVETSADGGSAKLVILDPSLFRGKEVILSVRG